MVLQNAYKARASRKYNAARGGASSSGGRGQSDSRGHGRGRGRGGSARQWQDQHGGCDSDEYDSEDYDGREPDDDEDKDEVESSAAKPTNRDINFPSLSSTKEGVSPDTPQALASKGERSKYSRRKLGDNSWRFKEEEVDPNAEEEEPEPEVDISSLLARVASLGSTAPVGVRAVGQGAHESADTAEDIEADIDRSLSYLHSKQRERERGKGRSVSHLEDNGLDAQGEPVQSIDPEELAAMRQEKETAEALRALKERFQGRSTGERVRTALTKRIPGAAIPAAPQSKGRGDRRVTGGFQAPTEEEDVDEFLASLGGNAGQDTGNDGGELADTRFKLRSSNPFSAATRHTVTRSDGQDDDYQRTRQKPKVEDLESFLDGMLG